MLRARFGILLRGFAGALLVSAVARGADTPLSRYATVEIEKAKTSIYVGSIMMTMPPFTRKDGIFASTFVAKVFPYFFYNDKGKIFIDAPDEALLKLERGETVDFTGRGQCESGEEYRLEGRAVPTNAAGGKIKVRVFVSKKIELIFNTTYRFPGATTKP